MQNMTSHFNDQAWRKEIADLILFWWFLLVIEEQQRQIDERFDALIESFSNPPGPPKLG